MRMYWFFVLCFIILCTDSLVFTLYVRVTKKKGKLKCVFFVYGREILNRKNICISDRIINILRELYHLAPSFTTGTTIGAGIGKFCGSTCLK
jgi:hypothetical protein